MEGNGAEAADGGEEKKGEPSTPAAAQQNLVKKWLSQFNSTGRRIDVVSRLLFPIMFLIFNLTYWSTYADYEGLRSLSVLKKIPYN